jgi:hypothetical protein
MATAIGNKHINEIDEVRRSEGSSFFKVSKVSMVGHRRAITT